MRNKHPDKTADGRRSSSDNKCAMSTGALLLMIFLVEWVIFTPNNRGLPFTNRSLELTMQKIPGWAKITFTGERVEDTKCKGKPLGSEPLPKGIVGQTADLEMQPLFGPISANKGNSNASKNLLAVAIGIKQNETVDRLVTKFISRNFTIMLFHYDGKVDEWKHYRWCDKAVHVSAINQTKWWFARRFLHPDIVAEYNYIFLWDEDLGIEHFDPKRYLDIIQEERLEISQPALDTRRRSSVHYDFTARQEGKTVHRRVTDPSGVNRCNENITGPPCTGFVEMMAPVFSRNAWRCVWHMIQNDLISGWGMDFKFGYCAQGERTEKIGIVDAEYIEHRAILSLGGPGHQKAPSPTSSEDGREKFNKRSFTEWWMFETRWNVAKEKDECWNDPYARKIK